MSLENNKLIAEFMGDHDFEHTEGGLPLGDFSNSWDWLMPVVGKIGEDNTYPRSLMIDSLSVFDSINRYYAAVVEYIKWYNKDSSILLHYDINVTVNNDQAEDIEGAFEEGSYTGDYQYNDGDGVMSISFDKLDDLVKFSKELRNRGYAV